MKKRKPTQAELIELLRAAYMVKCERDGGSKEYLAAMSRYSPPNNAAGIRLIKGCIKYFGAVKS